jgi:hypothetical protein
MSYSIPDGDTPLATIPRFLVPDRTGAMVPKSDLTALRDGVSSIISKASRFELTPHQIDSTFGFQKRYYFVDHAFPLLSGNIQPAYDSLRLSVDSHSMPSKRDVESLHYRGAVTLGGVVKLALAFQVAIKHGNKAACTYFGLGAGNPLDPVVGRAIVPALRLVRSQALREARRLLDGTEKEFLSFAVKANRPMPRDGIFERHLEKGYPIGGRGGRMEDRGQYLLTEPSASLIYEYLKYRAGVAHRGSEALLPYDELFPNDPTKFPGKGLYCVPLEAKLGNFMS